MTERFDWDLNGIWDYQSDSDEYLESSKEICELLNKLHKENQELRLLIDTLKEQNMKFKLRLKDLGVEYL